MKKFQIFFVLIALLATSQSVSAKHILASFFQYTQQSPGLYKITITLFRDCSTGSNFDNNLYIGVYDAQSDSLLQNIPTPSPIISQEMYSPMCLDKAVYSFTASLSTKVYLTWGRCCRNANILNILVPYDMGMANGVTIDPNVPNSSPSYQTPIPFFLMVGQTNTISLAAFDADGDSLAYKMVTPRSAGDNNYPTLTVGPPMPFDQVAFTNNASANNPIGSWGSWVLDETTGNATIQSSHLGLYAWAYMIEEWRNGVRISQSTYEGIFYVENSIVANEVKEGFNQGINVHFSDDNNLIITAIDEKPLGRFTLIDMNGKSVYQANNLMSSSYNLPTLGLSKGIYCLQFGRNNQIETMKVLLK